MQDVSINFEWLPWNCKHSCPVHTTPEKFEKNVTPAFSVTCTGDIVRPSLNMPSLDMLSKWLKDRLTVKLAIFPVISRTNDN